MRPLLIAVAAAALTVTTITVPTTARAAESLTDEFDGAAGAAPDSALWRYDTGGGGWGNNEKQTYTNSRENSRLDGNGNLLIQARGSGNSWTSARLTTKGTFSFTYGTVAARIAIPHGQGLHTGFWTLGTDHDLVGFPRSGELDIAEAINANDWVHVGLHGPTGLTTGSGSIDSGSAAFGSLAGVLPLPDGLNGRYQHGYNITGIDPTAFHTYAVTKTSTQITFSFDGSAVYTFKRSGLATGEQWVFDKPMYAILNLAVGGIWPGAADSTTPSPATMTVAWVRYSP
ncbi:glycoside hydrolase family 16 protein [Gordonia sp. CPCC 206044]|uniref:glycoside hydrolase family 16 protein n=1 Tax=Gordonia sp. CPCC 206044 TaxID=3140793 RepID=UPI003AF403C3